jgi:hypothetical protein
VWTFTGLPVATASPTPTFHHATSHPIVVVDLDPDADPPKLLVIGPDRAGNLLEVIVLELAAEQRLAIHAMALRPALHNLLPAPEERDG